MTKETKSFEFFGRSRLMLWGVMRGVFLVGAVLRLSSLTNPPLDYHADRQLYCAIIAPGIYCQLIACGDEKYRQTAIALWKEETVYEPQILEWLTALSYLISGEESLWVVRVLNSIFWLVGGITLFALACRMTSSDGAVAALTVYVFLDFAVFVNRAFLLETFMLMWTILAALALYRWWDCNKWKWEVGNFRGHFERLGDLGQGGGCFSDSRHVYIAGLDESRHFTKA